MAVLLATAVAVLSACSSAPATPNPSTGAAASIPAVIPEPTTVPRPTPAMPSAAVEPASAAVVPAMTGSRPIRVEIPAIGADSELLDLGLQPDGTMEVPPDAVSVGWFTGGPTPGELGPAVIVGHVDWSGDRGIFYDLRNLAPADEITVTREDGSVAVFAVTSSEQYSKSEFPTGAVYGNIDHAGLRLITCGGSFDPAARSYLDNIIVFADLVESVGGG